MNYLSHYYLARLVRPDASPTFFVGNALPDLLRVEGSGGRLRPVHLAVSPDPDLAGGAALHLAQDRRFHQAAAFAPLTREAGAALRGAGFAQPPQRVFFLAHVWVELALDAVLLQRDPALADHFYASFDNVDLTQAARATETMLDRSLPDLAPTLTHFAQSRFLYTYATDDGLAGALHQISRRAGLDNFDAPGDGDRLARTFTQLGKRVAQASAALLTP